MIIDGRQIAADILAQTKEGVAQLGRPVSVRAVVMQPNAVTHSYLKTKNARAEDAGMQMEIVHLADDVGDDELIAAVEDTDADAVIVQLPLPDTVTTEAVIDSIPQGKDADVLSREGYERFAYAEEGALLPPVVGAVKEILERAHVEVAGKRAVVVGAGKLVGQPVSVWLERAGANVSVITLETGDHELLAHADIIVSGAGSPRFITPDHVKEGVVLIDAGTSESNGAIAGDVDPACADKASVFTPVPGGVGPIAVACLFRNVLELAKRASK